MKSRFLLPMCGLLALTAPRAFASAMLKPTSGVTQALTPKSLDVEAHLRGAFAKTTVTTIYANPNNDRIEADFLYSAPKGSVVTGFAYWYGQEKVVARVVEKGRATKIYKYITSRMRDPALIEMVGKNSFRARIFPIEARADLKIEIQLAQTLPQTQAGALWTYPLREETKDLALQDVNIRLHSSSATSSNMGAFKNGKLAIEKHQFKATADLRALIAQKPAPLRASVVAARDGGKDGFFAVSLSSATLVSRPSIRISGVPTYEVLVPKMPRLTANQALVVTGRYRGQGTATITLNGRSVPLVFPATIEKNNLAADLWAANRIEALSENQKNQTKVMELSKRFGVPSKWTSWLAIPTAERLTFQRQMWASDRAEAATAYAQALARSDAKTAKAQKLIFEDRTSKLQADGPNYAATEELQPLSSYLNDELRRIQKTLVQAKYDDSIPKTQLAQWQKWADNLKSAGADDGGKGVDLPVYVIEDELRIASRSYLEEVELGRIDSAKARAYKARLKELAQTKTAQEYGWNENTFMGEATSVRANALAMDIAANSLSDKPDPKRDAQARARLNRLAAATSINAKEYIDSAQQTIWSSKIQSLAQKWTSEIQAGRTSDSDFQKFQQEINALKKRSGLTAIESIDWYALVTTAAQQAAPTIQAQGPNGAAAQKLEVQIKQISRFAGSTDGHLRGTAWNAVSSQLTDQLSDAIYSAGPTSQKAQQYQSLLESIVKKQGASTSNFVLQARREAERKTATELATEITAKRENSPLAQKLTAKLTEISKYTKGDGYNYNDWITASAWRQRIQEVVNLQLEEVIKNGPSSPRAQQLQARGEALAGKAKTNTGEFQQDAGRPLLEKLNMQLAEEIAARREKGAKFNETRIKRDRLLAAVPGLSSYPAYGKTTIDFISETQAHIWAYRMIEAQQGGDTKKADVYKREFNNALLRANISGDDILRWEGWKVESGQPLLTTMDYHLRPGDPLISVQAPANCRKVVAVMPDGTLLPLVYNAKKRAWEAHFDVSMDAAHGDYAVKIVIIAADGTRKHLTMHFSVDLNAPRGAASLQREGNTGHLRLEADKKTIRVLAILPWNEKVELSRGKDGVFATDVAVPIGTTDSSRVRFILTDKAHNRTEMWVDWK